MEKVLTEVAEKTIGLNPTHEKLASPNMNELYDNQENSTMDRLSGDDGRNIDRYVDQGSFNQQEMEVG